LAGATTIFISYRVIMSEIEASVMPMPTPGSRLSAIISKLQECSQSFRGALRCAVLLGLGSAVVGATFAWLVSLFVPFEKMGGFAADALYASGRIYPIVVMAAVWAPIYETVVGQWLPILVVRFIKGSDLVCVVVSAAVFCGGHVWAGGGWFQAIITALFGTLLATVYVANQHHGALKATVIAGTVHAVHNSSLLLLSFVVK
jgi:hypothetical protein